ncbi:hypothetical protein GpartN1_g629.t1 [Galdieria partita]|uniref:Profilin n=2 Tax=Galdieria TaxID=83373 RepID=A0A9C7PQH1_9RHOD|nr:hypothetical protein GAYE_SCF02G2172 [Galdieria yellowstonensis]GJQ08838.1 hypothetical protein GpartN1_g629.t1 [Galdieria partita]
MSWQSYIDDNLLASGFCYAAICGFDGSPWANSPGFQLLPEEATLLSKVLSEGNIDTIASSGFTVAGQKYAFTRADLDDEEAAPSIQGRCKEEGLSGRGLIVMKSNQALIVGVHDPEYTSATFRQVNLDMTNLANYLMENGF